MLNTKTPQRPFGRRNIDQSTPWARGCLYSKIRALYPNLSRNPLSSFLPGRPHRSPRLGPHSPPPVAEPCLGEIYFLGGRMWSQGPSKLMTFKKIERLTSWERSSPSGLAFEGWTAIADLGWAQGCLRKESCISRNLCCLPGLLHFLVVCSQYGLPSLVPLHTTPSSLATTCTGHGFQGFLGTPEFLSW